jgi:hypothetical protein
MVASKLQMRWILLLLLALCGCSESIQQKTYPVTGEVRLDGKPAKGITVVLRPIDKSKFKWEEIPQAITDDNGKFSIRTYLSDDGAPAGEYRVGIALMAPPSDEGDDQVKRDANAPRFPIKYADPEKSGLQATVDPKATVLPPFDLSSR